MTWSWFFLLGSDQVVLLFLLAFDHIVLLPSSLLSFPSHGVASHHIVCFTKITWSCFFFWHMITMALLLFSCF